MFLLCGCILFVMSDVTQILALIEDGDPSAADQLLTILYNELRRLAAAKLSCEKSGQTLQPTDLVHEAYIRLIDSQSEQHWNGRSHFFAAAAEAMRRILIDSARRKMRLKHGANAQRLELHSDMLVTQVSPERLLAIDLALAALEDEDPLAAKLVKLRCFAGFSIEEAAEMIGVSRSSAYEHWSYARAWLRCELANEADS